MSKLICSKCMKVHTTEDGKCPECNAGPPHVYNFENSDKYLREHLPKIREERKESGLEGLVGGLECVIINTEPDTQKAALAELLQYTGLEFQGAFTDPEYTTGVLTEAGSADFLVRSRNKKKNPFAEFNNFPKSMHMPNTRLETFVFDTKDIQEYVSIQESRGVHFLKDITHTDTYSFVQTIPSAYTGNSLGFIEWVNKGDYFTSESDELAWQMEKPDRDYLKHIKELDHTATRARAQDRDATIIEFMELTNYNFDFAIYVKLFNSITNVARLSAKDFAMVFTSGISPYTSDEESGPTERFIHNYGTRVHHMAFRTEKIEDTVTLLGEDGMGFLIELVGSPDEGLKQTFSQPSAHTLLVNEYIHRYGDFDGFFTRSNVTLLTEATEKQ
jgi:4-hydroxyphenylpyruvate dioxygenase-like putative hemolysin